MRTGLCVSVFSMGRQVGVVGRTGAGKTSLWGVLLRLMTSTQGAVLIDGIDTRTVPCHELRKRIAVMPQVGQHCLPPPPPTRHPHERSRVRVPAGAEGEFSSPWSTFCADSYFGIRSTPVLPQEHVKDPGHSVKNAGGRLQLTMHTPYVCGFA